MRHNILIIAYNTSYQEELLRLLLLLQHTYFLKNAPLPVRELGEEKDAVRSYKNYIGQIHEGIDDNWKVFLAISGGKIIGCIIGSIEKDEELVKGNIGKIEDWYVEDEYRGKGIGMKLYAALEQWYITNGCDQVISDTWQGNEVSIHAHLKSGFFVSGVSFGKKLK